MMQNIFWIIFILNITYVDSFKENNLRLLFKIEEDSYNNIITTKYNKTRAFEYNFILNKNIFHPKEKKKRNNFRNKTKKNSDK
tara:strand:+ start:2275 stop:2523 length:249 start_codon:yes stop_codon:yes gene_type:complete